MEKKKNKITLGSFDLVKGISILCVMILHTLSYYNMDKMPVLLPVVSLVSCCCFGVMPLFFIVSGFGMQTTTPGKMLKKTFSGFVIPYLWVMAGYAVIYPLVMMCLYHSWPNAVHETLRFLFAFLLGLPKEGLQLGAFALRSCTAAWFLLAMFIALNILNLILRVKKESVQAFLVILCVALGGIMGYLKYTKYGFFCIPQGLVVVGMCYIGHVIKKYKLFEKLLNSVWTYVILIPIAIAELLWGHLDLAAATYNNFVLDYIGGCCSGLLLMLVGFRLGKLEWRGLDWLKKMGTYSYWIFCIHSVEMMALPWSVWSQHMANHQQLAYLIESVLRAGIIVVVCVILKRKMQKYGR